jgi:hypothetical protein
MFRIFTARIPAELVEFEHALYYSDGYLNQTRDHVKDLQKYLTENYGIAPMDHEKSSTSDGTVLLESSSLSISDEILTGQ